VETSESQLRALMIASLDGDAAAYRVLLADLRRRLNAYFARRLRQSSADVDDLVQDTLMAIHTRSETYDRSQFFTAWAFAIARYKLIDHYRRSGRRVLVPLEDAGALFAEDESGAAEARADIERALARLPERTRALVRGVKLEELSHAEAAARSGMTEGAVKVAVHRGLKALTAQFGGRSDDDDR
jgi:RNA polymerase sigma-70 factor (ECF subfamily)